MKLFFFGFKIFYDMKRSDNSDYMRRQEILQKVKSPGSCERSWFGYQLNRIRVYYIRKKRLAGNDDKVVTDLPGARLWRKLDYVVRIPFVTEMIPIKHVIGVFLFCAINIIFILMSPFQIDTHKKYFVANIGRLDRNGAFVGMANWGFVFFLAQRNSILPKLSGMTFEELITFHRIVSRVGLAEFFPHFVWRIMKGYGKTYIAKDALFYDLEQTSGTISMLGFLIMFATSIEYIRRNYFEVFYYCHVIFLMVAIVFACIHEHTCLAFFIPAVILWFVDRVLRSYQSWVNKPSYVHVEPCVPKAENKSGGIVRVLFENKALRYFKPGQYVFASIVMNGRKVWEYANWHPFTISEIFRVNSTDRLDGEIEERVIAHHMKNENSEKIDCDSSSQPSTLETGQTADLRRRTNALFSAHHEQKDVKTMATIHIKALGSNTRRLLEAASDTNPNLKVYVDGPFGPQHEYQDYPVLTLYATGIGVTPAMAFIKDAIDRRSHGVRTVATEAIYLTWAIPNINEIEPFMDLFTFWVEECKAAVQPLALYVTIYVTRIESGPPVVEHLSGFRVVYGHRPDIKQDMDQITASHPGRRVWAHVCGSATFTRTVINQSILHNFEVHKETFEF
ncbi:MAG: hypothetical protein EXX96DRAFT_540913 [Benjaminiella poitrasii]|nr:MAG: hypothetical protein EXX96DRAFT_540913 [Benjaminiella poitrasii]